MMIRFQLQRPEEVSIPGVPTMEYFDWCYPMRRDMQEIVPGLFLGPYSAAGKAKLDNLLRLGITHIVCVRANIEAHLIRPIFPDRFKYLVLDINDSYTENILQHFTKVNCFISEALQYGGKVLVHGNGGISRSPTLVMAYLMETYSITCQESFMATQHRRMCICPHEGFMKQLEEFEPIYKARKALQLGQRSFQVQECNKRHIEDEEARAMQPQEKYAKRDFGHTITFNEPDFCNDISLD